MRSGEFYAKQFITHICADGKNVWFTPTPSYIVMSWLLAYHVWI